MAYDFIPVFLFGVLFVVIGLKLENGGTIGTIKIGLLLGGILLILWGGISGWQELSNF